MKKIFLLFSLFAALFFCGCMSLEKIQKNANAGDEYAQVLMGLKYFYGSNDVKLIQYDDARRYFEMAAKQENPLACYYLGEIYEFGLGQIDVDYDAASGYYSRAVKTMHELRSPLNRHARLAMAKMYDFGRGVKVSEAKAKLNYELAYNNNILGSGPLLADFLKRTRGPLSADSLAKILENAIDNNEPHANYLYGMAIMKSSPARANEYIRKASDGNFSLAIIEYAKNSRNKMLMQSALGKAAANGLGNAFYELALRESKEEKRYELLKKGADRGCINAMQALGDYFENRKEWNSAVIYHFMADRCRSGKFKSPASVRLERTVGLGLAAESIWQDKNIAAIAKIGTNVEYFIRGKRAGIAKIREIYQKYIEEDPAKSYVNMDYVRLFYAGMPMLMAGDIFRIYYRSCHGAVGNDFYLNYAVAAGYAGQGAVQFRAAEKINLSRNIPVKWHLAKMLLKANAMALMNREADAYEFLVASYRSNLKENDYNFIVDFVNANCNMLLKDNRKLSAALNIPAERFVQCKNLKKQDFYDLENRCDTNLLSVWEEPVINIKKK